MTFTSYIDDCTTSSGARHTGSNYYGHHVNARSLLLLLLLPRRPPSPTHRLRREKSFVTLLGSSSSSNDSSIREQHHQHQQQQQRQRHRHRQQNNSFPVEPSISSTDTISIASSTSSSSSSSLSSMQLRLAPVSPLIGTESEQCCENRHVLLSCWMTSLSISTGFILPLTGVLPSTATAAAAATSIINNNNDNNVTNTIIFIIGLIPFVVASIEFWRRIAVGDSFGTGTDSIVFPSQQQEEQRNTTTTTTTTTIRTFTIGKDDTPLESRGRRVLGQDSLIVAYVLFTIAAAVLSIVFYSVFTTPPLEN
jgi:hypothetical protein